ncbi:MAG TPA: hypothetical protein VLC46_01035 [Thermoanaerobaculia bacterium]|jgi:hypothetical protein|nr:hypothetical protein [Thermoanaerobaculia bacterium]
MSDLQKAAAQARDFLALYSPNKPPRFAAPGAEILQPARMIREALEEAQFILVETSRAALQSRIKELAKMRGRQRIINGLHLVSGSGFVVLIAGLYPDQIKWIGAVISLGAGIFALTLPTDQQSVETDVFNDAATASRLSGEITRIQTRLLFKTVEEEPALIDEISTVIGRASELSTKYRLNDIAAASGFYPRTDRPATDAAKTG